MHGQISSMRNLPGGGPQGATLGILEYTSQSNHNCDFVEADMRYKFVDDLSILEKINLINIGATSYNFRQHVASDVGINQLFVPSSNLKAQNYLNNIQEWTKNKINCFARRRPSSP